MEKTKTTVTYEVNTNIPFMLDYHAYEEAVDFFREYANATWKKTITAVPSSAESPNNNKEWFIWHTPKD